MRTGRSVGVVALVAADLVALARLRPHPAGLIHDLAAPHEWGERVGADTALATLAGAALWVAALWLATGLAAAAATRLPGAGGRGSARVCRVLLPRALRSVVAGSAGLGVLLAPAVALADHGTVPGAGALPPPAWPVGPGASAAPPAAQPSTPARTAEPAHSVRVRPGDTLWAIAARSLGPRAGAEQIAAEWPRWFAANRSVIGTDPAFIRPGQVLAPPTPSAGAEEDRS